MKRRIHANVRGAQNVDKDHFVNTGLFVSKLHAAGSEPPNPFLGLDTVPAAAHTGEAGASSTKTALDDLNESIRYAMTVRSNSPGKQ